MSTGNRIWADSVFDSSDGSEQDSFDALHLEEFEKHINVDETAVRYVMAVVGVCASFAESEIVLLMQRTLRQSSSLQSNVREQLFA